MGTIYGVLRVHLEPSPGRPARLFAGRRRPGIYHAADLLRPQAPDVCSWGCVCVTQPGQYVCLTSVLVVVAVSARGDVAQYYNTQMCLDLSGECEDSYALHRALSQRHEEAGELLKSPSPPPSHVKASQPRARCGCRPVLIVSRTRATRPRPGPGPAAGEGPPR
ncbi:hypothetical protein JYU34_008369, partial [Plutella xylostella]